MVVLNYFTFSLVLGGLIGLGSAVAAWNYTGKARISWFLLSINAVAWSSSYLLLLTAPDEAAAKTYNVLMQAMMILLPLSITYFVTTLTQQTVRYKAYIQTLIVMGFIFEVLNSTPLLVKHVVSGSVMNYVPAAGPLYLHFIIYFFGATLFACYIALRAMRSADAHDRTRLYFVMFGIAGAVAGFAGVFPHFFGLNMLPWSLACISLFPIIITYAMIRQKLFTTQTIASELFIILLWFIFLMRTVLSQSFTEFLTESVVLVATLIFGSLLIRNVHKEAENRERGERLARYLANANARLRELDKQKTEFVSLASHQLRGPIAAIVGYVSLIQEQSYGKVPDHLKEPLSRIFESGKRISLMVDDFLNVTRIEQGRMSYTFVTADVTPLITRVVDEFRVIAEKKGLSMTFVPPTDGQVLVRVDEGKFAQVLQNLIDNAIKFTPQGSVTIGVRTNERKTKALITITDTGIGIAPDEVHNLSHKFNRASNANSVSVYGSGLGLYISKEILKAHDGWIYISSPGIDKGSVFTIEVPTEQGERIE